MNWFKLNVIIIIAQTNLVNHFIIWTHVNLTFQFNWYHFSQILIRSVLLIFFHIYLTSKSITELKLRFYFTYKKLLQLILLSHLMNKIFLLMSFHFLVFGRLGRGYSGFKKNHFFDKFIIFLINNILVGLIYRINIFYIIKIQNK